MAIAEEMPEGVSKVTWPAGWSRQDHAGLGLLFRNREQNVSNPAVPLLREQAENSGRRRRRSALPRGLR